MIVASTGNSNVSLYSHPLHALGCPFALFNATSKHRHIHTFPILFRAVHDSHSMFGFSDLSLVPLRCSYQDVSGEGNRQEQ